MLSAIKKPANIPTLEKGVKFYFDPKFRYWFIQFNQSPIERGTEKLNKLNEWVSIKHYVLLSWYKRTQKSPAGTSFTKIILSGLKRKNSLPIFNRCFKQFSFLYARTVEFLNVRNCNAGIHDKSLFGGFRYFFLRRIEKMKQIRLSCFEE